MGKGKPERAQAVAFLRRVQHEAERLAEVLDPRRRRDYGDPVLRALDAITNAATRALDQEDAPHD